MELLLQNIGLRYGNTQYLTITCILEDVSYLSLRFGWKAFTFLALFSISWKELFVLVLSVHLLLSMEEQEGRCQALTNCCRVG